MKDFLTLSHTSCSTSESVVPSLIPDPEIGTPFGQSRPIIGHYIRSNQEQEPIMGSCQERIPFNNLKKNCLGMKFELTKLFNYELL